MADGTDSRPTLLTWVLVDRTGFEAHNWLLFGQFHVSVFHEAGE